MQHPNERIDPFTGKLQWHFVDLYIPGNGGLDIKVQRSYSSLNEMLSDDSPYGAGWTIHYGRVLRKASVNMCVTGQSPASNPVLELPDGSRQVLYDSLDTSYHIGPGLWKMTCNNAPEGGVIVQSPDGMRYEMTTVGPLVGTSPTTQQNTLYTTRMIDRNGNTLSFTYVFLNSSMLAVQTITASDGRTVTFNYTDGALSSIVGGGATWTYSLTPIPNQGGHQYFLNSVVRPDGTLWTYEYNQTASGPGLGTAGGYSMKKATYPTGGAITYTYGFVAFSSNSSIPTSTAVIQKQTNDGTWTYAYTPATTQMDFSGGGVDFTIDPSKPNNQFDKTVVTGPEGSIEYLHVGYTSVISGAAYLIGTLAGKISSSMVSGTSSITEIVANSWDFGLISNQPNTKPGGTFTSDAQTAIPILADSSISRNNQIYETQYSDFDSYFNAQTVKEIGTDTRTTTVSYYADPDKWIIHQKQDESTDTIGDIARTFDPNGNLQTLTKYGVTTTYTYRGSGDIATKEDALGNTTTYDNYSHGIPQTEAQPEAVNISRMVDQAGNVSQQTDGTGAATSYTYDGLNRLRSITHPVGNAVSVDWTSNSRTVTRGNYREVVTFDAFGRETQVQYTDLGTSQAVTQTYQYDSLSRKIFASYPNATIGTAFVYDILGRKLGYYNGYDPSTASHSSTRLYQYIDNTVVMTNERGYNYTYTYREYGDPDHRDLMAISAPLASASVTMTKNGLGQILSVSQDSVTRTYTYDGSYYLRTMTDPEVGTTTYGRDLMGNMTSKQVGTSGTTTFGYDGRDRLTTVSYPGTGTPNVTRTYYADDKLKTTTNTVALHEYTYDPNKNLTQEKLTVGTQSPFVVGYGYDGDDALATVTYASGNVVDYSPDAFGRPTRAAPYVNAVTHHPNGQIATLTYANAVQATIGLSDRQWPQTLQVSHGSNVLSTTYTYDELGNVYGIQDLVDGTYNRAFDYDPVDRVTTASGSWGPGTIAYNGHGDITSQSLGGALGITYNYDPSNRLASVTGSRNYTFAYDVYGNVSSNGQHSFTYDDASNMRCSDCGLGTEVDYDYDAANMRVKATKAGVSTYYIYGANGSLLAERVPGADLTEYIYLGGKQVAVRHKTGS